VIRTWDVIVVGAGPAGSAAARACAGAGLSVLCLEEHGTVGHPVQCAGLLSTNALGECRVSERSVLHRVSGARLVSSLGSELLIDAGRTKAYVVDRGVLDREMAWSAADSGAEFRTKTAVCGIGDGTVSTRGVCGHEQFGFRLLIAADGPRSTVARLKGLQRAKVTLAGIQAEVPFEMDERFVEIHPDASPSFFAWAIPAGGGRVRAGLCGTSKVRTCFEAFIARFGGSCLHLVTGALPLGVMPRTYGDRVLYTGDAAGFAKPTSGGGVYTGVRSARHAASVAIACCERDSFADADLASYEKRWKRDLGRELTLGYRLFEARQKLSPSDIDRIVRTLNDPGIREIITEYGDMDRPSALIRRLSTKPSLVKLLGIFLRTMV
jgi:digeranylgeranylglycerophospholipid reductase